MIILLKKRKNFKNCKYSRLPIETKTRMQVHQKQEGNLSLVPQQASRKFLFDHDSLAAKTKKNFNKPSQTIANSANKNTNHVRFYQTPEEGKFSPWQPDPPVRFSLYKKKQESRKMQLATIPNQANENQSCKFTIQPDSPMTLSLQKKKQES